MARKRLLYPTVSKSLTEEIGCGIKIGFYILPDKENPVATIDRPYENRDYVVNNENDSWSPNSDVLEISIDMSLENPSLLFGRIVPMKCEVGIAVAMKSASAKNKQFFRIGRLHSELDKFEINKRISIQNGTLRENFILELLFYIENSSNCVDDSEKYLANKKGMIVGSVLQSRIIVDGIGSEFPVKLVDEKDGPLWELNMSFMDLHEEFKDSVSITLNQSHKDYKYCMDSSTVASKNISELILKEIMTSTVTMIISRAVTINYGEIEDDFEYGSIGKVVNYYFDVYNINKNMDIEEMYRNISKVIRERG